jgi:hypothetical protein
LHGFAQNGQVPILNMPSVFPEVHHNSITPGQVNQRGCHHGVGIMSSTSLAKCRHMVDIDAELCQ